MNRPQRVFLVLGILFVVGFFVSYFVVDFPFAAAGLNRELARAKANHIPLVREDLHPSPLVRPDQNAGPALVELGTKISEGVRKFDSASKAKEQLTVDELESAHLKVIEPYLPAFLAANRKPQYWVDRDYDQFLRLLFPELAGFKQVGKALAARARLRANKGDLKGAIDDLNAGFQLAHHLNDEPFLIGQLVAIATYNIEAVGVERLAADRVNDRLALQMLRQEVIEKSAPPTNLEKGLRGEMYMVISTIRNMKRLDGYTSGSGDQVNTDIPLQRRGKPTGIIWQGFLSRALGYWNDLVESEAWKDNDPQRIGKEMVLLGNKHHPKGTIRLSTTLDAILMPVYNQSGLAYVNAEAQKRTMRSLLLVLEYHAVHKQFPATLKEAGADALDPFLKDTPLHYAASEKTVKVWSVGKNGKDDGGESKKTLDMVAMYPPRKRS